MSQVPPNGVHEYGGTQDGNQTGSFTGSINGGSVVMNQETTQIIREHSIHKQTLEVESTGSHVFQIDPSPLQLGDIDKSLSKTRVEVFAYISTQDSASITEIDVLWREGVGGSGISTLSNCDISQTTIRFDRGGIGDDTAGGAESRLTCTLDTYRDSSFTIDGQVLNLQSGTGEKVGVTVWQTEVVNVTRPGNSGTVTGNVSGTTTGTYTGEHRGEIEQINATSSSNTTAVENLTATNFTFSNIFGAIQLEFDLPFLLLVAAILLIVLAEWRKDPFILLLSVLPLIFYAIEVDNNNWRVIIVAFTLYAAARASMVIYESRKEGEEDDE